MEDQASTELQAVWDGMQRRRHWMIARMIAAALIIVGLLVFPMVLITGWLGLAGWVWTALGGGVTGHLLATGLQLVSNVERETQSRAIWRFSRELNAIESQHLRDWVDYHAERRKAGEG